MGAQTSMNHILLTMDEAFVRPAAVALRSASRNCVVETMRVTVIDCGLSEHAQQLLENAWGDTIDFPQLDSRHVQEFASTFPAAGMARLALEHYVDESCHRILYLDSDVLVRGPIDSLFTTDLQGFTLGAIPAIVRLPMGYDIDGSWLESEYAAGGAAPGGMVFNTGVMLIDMVRWRNQNVFERALQLGRAFAVADQRLLNGILSDDWLPLPEVWNTKSQDAVIYHFAADPRPWQRNYYRNDVWLEYLDVARSIGWQIDHPPLLSLRVRGRQLAARLRH